MSDKQRLMAFPLYAVVPGKMNAITGKQEVTAITQGGMELRDYFAGMWSMTYIQSGGEQVQSYYEIARDCYHFADALLKAREL